MSVHAQAKGPVTSGWDSRMSQYRHAAESFAEGQQFHDSEFVRVEASTLAESAKDEALTWLRMLIAAMRGVDLPGIQVGCQPACACLVHGVCLSVKTASSHASE